jgi:hypothetical protein
LKEFKEGKRRYLKEVGHIIIGKKMMDEVERYRSWVGDGMLITYIYFFK